LGKAVNAYVMQDEARHVAFGRIALRDYYPQLTEGEKQEREEFLAEACSLMRDRLIPSEVWECVGLSKDQCLAITAASPQMRYFRHRLFSRIVPTVKDIGLWGEKIRAAYEAMGVLQYADIDAVSVLEKDDRVARDLDERGRSRPKPAGNGASGAAELIAQQRHPA
jgi:hypothetical protein